MAWATGVFIFFFFSINILEDQTLFTEPLCFPRVLSLASLAKDILSFSGQLEPVSLAWGLCPSSSREGGVQA